jgi:deoxyribodipyrimidine photo-lyase
MGSHATAKAITIVWFRGKDLRITDHAPLTEALKRGGDVLPVFVLDPFFFEPVRARELPHRMQYLLESIASLRENLRALGSDLLLVSGKSTEVIPNLARTLKASAVLAQRWSEPFARKRDELVKDALPCPLELLEGETLRPPSEIRTEAGTVHAVFSPFCRAFYKRGVLDAPLKAPKSLPPFEGFAKLASEALPTLATLGITENPRLTRGGERNARARLKAFIDGPLANYEQGRDQLPEAGTSRLSQDLKFGVLSPRFVFHAVTACADSVSKTRYLNELIWREFSHVSLFHRTELLKKPFKPAFNAFPWTRDPATLAWWTEGKTGYPVIDASARQLLQEGFVHNRARMISASFLTKHLQVHYQEGEAHYMKYLTDGDWAANNMGWQWSAGCGCDAQPYFRVFNPMTQGEKFDPEGVYIKRYLPELSKMPAKYIHKPWEAPANVLTLAGVELGKTYPKPVVDHSDARNAFLAAAKKHFGPKADAL